MNFNFNKINIVGKKAMLPATDNDFAKSVRKPAIADDIMIYLFSMMKSVPNLRRIRINIAIVY